MKTAKLFTALVLMMLMCFTATAQSGKGTAAQLKTESFKVWGNCGMCKDRIEKCLVSSGATSASWDSKTMMAKVTFNPSGTTVDALSKKVAAVGHDTEKYKADDKVYENLPGCCKYERVK